MNRLIHEKSPYLRQHAHNPVDWYPWGKEAFDKASRENKPIFLSIGYSTCHWCHVMEKESFEDKEIADLLNKFFVSIKVDREERPDIDSLYMKTCYVFQNRGGWPLSVFMTPDKKPFYVDTYIPKEDLYGKIGFKNLLLRISELWQKDREKLFEVSSKVVESLKKSTQKGLIKIKLDEGIIRKAYEALRLIYDRQHKGFGIKPKFPLPLNLFFLHRYFYRYGDKSSLDMSLQTLKKMRSGGIYDHLGFGFHRYSTDREWILPHFEKMLYDNALLMISYTEAYQITRDGFYRKVAEEIADYLLRDLMSPEGAFYSAEDADSEGEEGKFYLWDYREIEKILNSEEFKIFITFYPISNDGNFYEEATGQKNGKNIIYLTEDFENLEKTFGLSGEKLHSLLETIREKLYKARLKRVRPFRDEKILTDWNCLATVAFCKAAAAFRREDYHKVAENSMNFILNKLFDSKGILLHRYAYDESLIFGYIEDYANLIWALLELYFTTFKSEYLIKACEMTEHVLKHFWDSEKGGFFHTAHYAEVVLERLKDYYDGVTPSGNSVMAYNLTRLSRLTGNREYEELAIKTLDSFAHDIDRFPTSYIFAFIALDLLVNGSMELVTVIENQKNNEIEFLRDIQTNFLPDLNFLLKDTLTEKLNENLKELSTLESKTTYYLCRNFACQYPTCDRDKLLSMIFRDKTFKS